MEHCVPGRRLTLSLKTLQDDDEGGAVHPARPFYTDSGALAPNIFDSDLEKVDADSGSSGTPPDGMLQCFRVGACEWNPCPLAHTAIRSA